MTDRAFFGHPRGLAVLALTEGWVSFSLYGMQSLLVLYLASELLQPGHVEHVWGFAGFRTMLGWVMGPSSGTVLASAIMGLYSALIWATPIAGGLLADRLLGRTRTIVLGAVLMTAGHFLLAFDRSFLVALACLLAGLGCAGSLKAQVGGLYATADRRRADAFQLYSLVTSIAVVVSPLVCGTLGERYAWHWGFAAAGVGMLLGLLTYLGGLRTLPPEPMRGGHVVAPPLTGRDRRVLAVLVLLLPVLALASVGNMEVFNGYLLWGQAHYALRLGGRSMPVSWLVSLDALVAIGTLLASMAFWRWWGRHRPLPDEIVRMTAGAVLLALAPLVLVAASWQAGTQRIGLGWALLFHVVNDFGFSNLYPIGLALYSRLAPRALGATVVNGYVLHLFLANLLVGWLAGLLDRMDGARFWLLHAGLIGVAALLLLCVTAACRGLLATPASIRTGSDGVETFS